MHIIIYKTKHPLKNKYLHENTKPPPSKKCTKSTTNEGIQNNVCAKSLNTHQKYSAWFKIPYEKSSECCGVFKYSRSLWKLLKIALSPDIWSSVKLHKGHWKCTELQTPLTSLKINRNLMNIYENLPDCGNISPFYVERISKHLSKCCTKSLWDSNVGSSELGPLVKIKTVFTQ